MTSRSSVPTYTVRMRKADDYTADTSTSGTVAVGGFFYAPHEWDSVNNRFSQVDTDWIRASLSANTTYEITLRVHATGNTRGKIGNIKDSANNVVLSGSEEAGRKHSTVSRRFRPTTAGDYYIALTSRQHGEDTKHPAPNYTLSLSSR